MSSQLCILCLHVLDKGDTTAKYAQKINVETLYKLLASFHPNYKYAHLSEFDGNEMCDFCEDCYPLFSTMEEIKTQITLLEQEVGSKIKQIQATILDASSQLQESSVNHGREKVMLIRNMILRVTGKNDDQLENFVSDEVQVKLEDDVDDTDQFFDDDYNSYSQSSVEKTEEEEADNLLDEEEDDDTAFCITPCPQKRSRGRPKKLEKIKAISPRTKRKRQNSPLPKKQSKPKTSLKRIKLEPHQPPSQQATRSSPRVKNSTVSSNCVKTLVVSLKRIRPIKQSASISNSESSEEEETKYKCGDDKDWAPTSEDKNDPIRSHKCAFCPKSYTKESILNLHIRRYHHVPCIVPLCTARFRTGRARDDHLNRAHEGFAPYQCRICKKKCRRQNDLAAHMVIRHEKGEKKFTCGKCDKMFCLEDNFERHMKLHEVEGIKPLVCDVCDARFKNEEKLCRHLETHNARNRNRCHDCGKGFLDKSALDKHRRSHTGEKTEKCPHCDTILGDKTSLERHIARDHSTGPAHICHICGKGFYLSLDLKIHLDRHDGKFRPKIVKCDTCSETFLSLASLQSHLVTVHGNDPFVCEECGGRYTSLEGLKRHNKIHTGVKKHKCHTCGASFLRVDQLTNHVRSHTGERPFPCPHCEKAFKARRHLIQHVKGIHTPGYAIPTPHKCPHCSKGFQYRVVLEGHIRAVHTGERPFTCDQCGKGFAVKSTLVLHLKGAHGIISETKDRLPRSKKDAALHEAEEGHS